MITGLDLDLKDYWSSSLSSMATGLDLGLRNHWPWLWPWMCCSWSAPCYQSYYILVYFNCF